jgi:molybdopterin synthase sulfur carrier subunit
MNRFKVRAFGITRELLGGKEAFIEIRGQTVGDLRTELAERFPELQGLKSLYIAVNNDYSTDEQVLGPNDEIALIPPVSGG